MDFSNVVCPACRKLVREPINLICDHHLCFKCAERLIVLDSESQYERKYRIACPSCKRSTVTYDLRHLIISCTEYDEDLYVTSKYLTDKPEIKLKSPRFELHKNSKETDSPLMKYNCKKPSVPSDSERGSSNHKEPGPHSSGSATITPKTATSLPTTVKCSSHYSVFKYYCENDKTLLCSQCVKWHKEHRIVDLKAANETIIYENNRFKDEAKTKLSEAKKYINIANDNKKSLSVEFQNLLGSLDSEFKWLHEELNKRHQQLSTNLKNIYLMKIEEQTLSVSDLTESLKTLGEYSEFTFKDFDSQVYFFNLCASSKKKLQVLPPVPKNPGYMWQKNKDGIYESIEKFMKLKQISTGKPPVSGSDHQRKKSSHNASYLEMLSANVSRKGSSVCQQDLKEMRQPNTAKGSKEKQNYKPAASNVLQLDLKRLKF